MIITNTGSIEKPYGNKHTRAMREVYQNLDKHTVHCYLEDFNERKRPCQDSNLESPDSQSDALSVGPQGRKRCRSLRKKRNARSRRREQTATENSKRTRKIMFTFWCPENSFLRFEKEFKKAFLYALLLNFWLISVFVWSIINRSVTMRLTFFTKQSSSHANRDMWAPK